MALGPLIKLGCRLQWGDTECSLWHPDRGRLRLDISSGCPRVDESLALELVEEIERHKMSTIGAAVRAIRARQSHTLPEPELAVADLCDAVLRDCEVPAHLAQAVLALMGDLGLCSSYV